MEDALYLILEGEHQQTLKVLLGETHKIPSSGSRRIKLSVFLLVSFLCIAGAFTYRKMRLHEKAISAFMELIAFRNADKGYPVENVVHDGNKITASHLFHTWHQPCPAHSPTILVQQ
jgi:hypothetical protein